MDNPEVKNKVDKYDMNSAISDLNNLVGDTAYMLQRIKRTKFNYLMQTCDIYTKMDYPSIMMDVSDKEVKQVIPQTKNIRSMDF